MREYIMQVEVGNAPITVQELVRCRDCKHRVAESNDDWCECTGCDINPDGFCEEGERKETEDDA